MGLLSEIVNAVKCIVRVFMSALSHPLLPDGFLWDVLSYILDNKATVSLFCQHPMRLNIRSMIQPCFFFPKSGFFLHMAEKNKRCWLLSLFFVICLSAAVTRTENVQTISYHFCFNLLLLHIFKTWFCPVLFYLACLCYLDFFCYG